MLQFLNFSATTRPYENTYATDTLAIWHVHIQNYEHLW